MGKAMSMCPPERHADYHMASTTDEAASATTTKSRQQQQQQQLVQRYSTPRVKEGLDGLENLSKTISNRQLEELLDIVRDTTDYTMVAMFISRLVPFVTRVMGENEYPFIVYLADKKRWGNADAMASSHVLSQMIFDTMSIDQLVPPASITLEGHGIYVDEAIRHLDGEESCTVFALVAKHYQMPALAPMAAARLTHEDLFYDIRYQMLGSTYTTIGLMIATYGDEGSEDAFHGAVIAVIRWRCKDGMKSGGGGGGGAIDYPRMLSVRNNMGRTIVHLMAIHTDAGITCQFLTELLTAHPEAATMADNDGMTPLMYCAKMLNHSTARALHSFLPPDAFRCTNEKGLTAADFTKPWAESNPEEATLYIESESESVSVNE